MSTDTRHFVVLLDIDGTLIMPATRPSAAMLAMNQALFDVAGEYIFGPPHSLAGWSPEQAAARFKERFGDPAAYAGNTDLRIASFLLERVGGARADADAIFEMLDRYIERFEETVQKGAYQPVGDPVSAVEELDRSGAIVGLGTGNVRRGAELKLASAGLDALFDFELGGYGEDAEERSRLLAVGARRCDPSGELPVLVVGTPRGT